MDGIQPDRGNETVYVVRDALTGRVLAAENVTASETAVLKQLLAPVKALPVRVLGTMSDAQESLRQRVRADVARGAASSLSVSCFTGRFTTSL